MSFAQKVVLVTGGSAGIGASTAKLFAKECATVTIVGKDEENLYKVAEDCKKFGTSVLPIEADISKDVAAACIVQKTIEKFGKLDVLVNCAGILRESGILADNFLEVFDEVMNVNMRGLVRLTRLAVPHIIKTKGNIVNVSSIAGKCTATPNNIAYRTSKAAVDHFTRCAALELAPHGVRVNSISPGPVRTGLFDGLKVNFDKLTQLTALKKLAEPDEIAAVIVILASDKAKSVTGSDYVMDNGMLLKSR